MAADELRGGVPPRECGDPSCRCHIPDRTGMGWRLGAPDRTPTNAAHGTYTRYSKGCRCEECRAASAAYQRSRRAKALDAGR